VDDRLMTPEEVADVLQVSAEWVRECARRGDLPSIKLGHYRRFTRSDVDAFIESRRLSAPRAPSMISAVIQNGSRR
jgi:excisionase family DNA binding protein